MHDVRVLLRGGCPNSIKHTGGDVCSKECCLEKQRCLRSGGNLSTFRYHILDVTTTLYYLLVLVQKHPDSARQVSDPKPETASELRGDETLPEALI